MEDFGFYEIKNLDADSLGAEFDFLVPESLAVSGFEYFVSSWQGMYRRFVRYLADGNTEYIRSFVNKSFDGKGSIDVADKNGSDKLKKPCSILNDLWLEIALSPLEILSKMRALAFICNEPLSGIRITCINRAEEACGNPSSQIPLTDSSSVESGSNCRISCDALSETDKKAATERDFKDWIREHVPYFVARGVMQDLAKAFEIAGRE